MTGHALAAGCAALVFGCSSKSPYACSSSDQCVLGGASGTCEPQGFCSFADSSCASGRKFEPNAGDGLAGACVTGDAGIDAPVDAAPVASCAADVTFGRHFGCALGADHEVRCVGRNDSGQLGFGLAGPDSATWMEVRDSTTSSVITDATAIGAGGDHACMLRTGGAVWCWGWNTNGQVGNNSTANAPAAQPVVSGGQPLTGITAVDGGATHTCALGSGGGVWCWGSNGSGQCGDGTTTQRTQAVQVLDAAGGAAFAGAVEIAVGHDHNCARKASGDVWCWGSNFGGQLGNNSTANSPSPVMVTNAAHVIAGSNAHTCALASDGTVQCWGSSWRGRLGTGAGNNSAASHTPATVVTSVGGAPLAGVASIATGGSACAVMQDGMLRCWGDNVHGQNGDGAGSTVPSQVIFADGKPLTGVDRVMAHFPHVCAHRTTGEIYCWGRDVDGELGDGMTTQQSFPIPLVYPCP